MDQVLWALRPSQETNSQVGHGDHGLPWLFYRGKKATEVDWLASKYCLSTPEKTMAVLLTNACPRMRDALALGRECGAVYGVLWEAAWHDQRGWCGGTTELSHKAIADLCHMSNTTVIRAIDRLLDDGLIQFLHMVPTPRGSWKRRYRVTHPDQVEWQRQVIDLYEVPPSERAKRMADHVGRGLEQLDDDVCMAESPADVVTP